MSVRFALIDENNVVTEIRYIPDHIIYHGPMPDNAIGSPDACLGYIYDPADSSFTPPASPPEPLPQLVLTDVNFLDSPAFYFAGRVRILPDEISFSSDYGLNLRFEVHAADGSVVPVNGPFRLLLVASDGRQRSLQLDLRYGYIDCTIKLDSGVWHFQADPYDSPPQEARRMLINLPRIVSTI